MRSKRDEATDLGVSENGHAEQLARYEQQLADYLEKRLKPGLNRGSIPLVARSIAKEIAQEEYDEDADASDEAPGLEEDLRKLQAKLGEDWILYFAVHGDHMWLTAEKEDASQRIEAPTSAVLVKAVKALNEGGGRPT